MSSKRQKHRGRKRAADEAVPDEILAEGSGPNGVDAGVVAAAAEAQQVDGEVEHVDAAAAATPDARSLADVAAEALAAADARAAGPAGPAGPDDDDDDEDADDDFADFAEDSELAAASDALGGVTRHSGGVLADDGPTDEGLDAEALEAGGLAEDGLADPEAGEADAALPATAANMDAVQLKHLVEALVFAADRPLTLQRLRQLTRVSDVRRLEAALAELAVDFKDRGIALQQVSGGYQLRTHTQFSPWVQQLIAGRPVRLTRAQLETLAIIAYRQPITRPEIDDIRGVDSSGTLRVLLDRSLIRILGKREEVGRPILYGTTREFLDFFSLGDLRELPTLREYSELTAESRQVMSDRLGIGLEGEASAAADRFGDAADTLGDELPDGIGSDLAIDPDALIADALDADPLMTDVLIAEALAADPLVADVLAAEEQSDPLDAGARADDALDAGSGADDALDLQASGDETSSAAPTDMPTEVPTDAAFSQAEAPDDDATADPIGD